AIWLPGDPRPGSKPGDAAVSPQRARCPLTALAFGPHDKALATGSLYHTAAVADGPSSSNSRPALALARAVLGDLGCQVSDAAPDLAGGDEAFRTWRALTVGQAPAGVLESCELGLESLGHGAAAAESGGNGGERRHHEHGC